MKNILSFFHTKTMIFEYYICTRKSQYNYLLKTNISIINNNKIYLSEQFIKQNHKRKDLDFFFG